MAQTDAHPLDPRTISPEGAEEPPLTIDITDGVAFVRLNRPTRMNALTSPMRRGLIDAFTTLPREARAIVYTGVGRAFCAGQDLTDRSGAAREASNTGTAADVDLERSLSEEYEPMIKLITECPVPTVAAVNGVAAGAGANLALAADIVIAAQSASFIQAFARIGLLPDAGGTFWLPRLVGHARAMGLSLLAEPLDAPRAADWGLIWEVVPDDALEAHVIALARRLATGPTVAYKLAKEALRASAANGLEQQLALEAKLQGQAGKTRDFAEGVLAFLEKRPPRFEGR
ncbi:MAG: enoyl-CoA hydratase-related protein [Pseudomonadota bacterium]